jgi:hypothetical protein
MLLVGCAPASTDSTAAKIVTSINAPSDTAGAGLGQDPGGESPDSPHASPPLSPGTAVDGTQRVGIEGLSSDLVLDVPTGWIPSEYMDTSEYVLFIALAPERVDGFSANIVVTLESVGITLSDEEYFGYHSEFSAAFGLSSPRPGGTVGMLGGYPSHTISGTARENSMDLNQSSTMVLVDEAGVQVSMVIALTSHQNDTAGLALLHEILDSARFEVGSDSGGDI